MKILLADQLHPQSIEALAPQPGAVLDNQPGLSADDLPSEMAGAEILIVRSTKVSAATIQAADKLGLVIRAGSETKHGQRLRPFGVKLLAGLRSLTCACISLDAPAGRMSSRPNRTEEDFLSRPLGPLKRRANGR